MRVTYVDEGLEGALQAHATRRARFALCRYADRLGQVAVRLRAPPGGGCPWRCSVRVQVRGGGRLLLEAEEAEPRAALERTLEQAARAVARTLVRERVARSQGPCALPAAEAGRDPGSPSVR